MTLLGAQSGIGGGGRYDGLIEQLGGPPTPGGGLGHGARTHRAGAGVDGERVSCGPRGLS